MELFDEIDEIRPAAQGKGSVVTIGTFDGAHRGHLKVVDRCVEAARDAGMRSMVVTFADHPLSLLAPPHAPPLLTTRERKTELLRAAGVDALACLTFDETVASIAADDFARDVLFERCGAARIVCGYDFNFGRGGKGSPGTIEALGRECGVETEVVGPVIDDDHPISSTRIRESLLEGQVEIAAALLGRSFDLDGVVVAGFQRGRQMEFPTANLSVSCRVCVPLTGVYAAMARTADGRRWEAMMNIGHAPTFGVEDSRIEVHLFDFDGDLYGHNLRVEFIARLRDEATFDSPKALVAQLHRDREQAREALRDAAH